MSNEKIPVHRLSIISILIIRPSLKLIIVIILSKLINPMFALHFNFDRRFIKEWES